MKNEEDRAREWREQVAAADCTCPPCKTPRTGWAGLYSHRVECPTYAAVWGLEPYDERVGRGQ